MDRQTDRQCTSLCLTDCHHRRMLPRYIKLLTCSTMLPLRCAYTRLIRPVLLNGCETWNVTKTLAKHLDASDTWCLRKSLRILYTRHTINDTVQSITACSPVLAWVKSLRLSFFGHLARTTPKKDHHHIIAAALRPLLIGGGL